MKRQVQIKKYILFVPFLVSAMSTPAFAADTLTSQSITDITDGGSIRYIIRFGISGASNGIQPSVEQVMISSDPDSSNPYAGNMPSFQLTIAPGCFQDSTGAQVIYRANGTACGVTARLFNPLDNSSTPLTITGFNARLVNYHNTHGLLQANVGFSGFDATGNTNQGGEVSLTIGDDSLTGAPLNGRVVTRSP